MTEHIKKFESPSAANGHIIDNPFITSIIRGGGQILNLVCGDSGKKLINDNETVQIVDNLISFRLNKGGYIKTYYALPGMNWYQWAENEEYNTDYPNIEIYSWGIILSNDGRHIHTLDVQGSDLIINNMEYIVSVSDSSG